MNILRATLLLSALTAGLLFYSCATPNAGSKNVATAIPAETVAPAEHADLSGTWNYTMTNDTQGTLTGILTIQKGSSAGYTGRITANEMQLDNETSITKAQLNGSDFIYEGVVKSSQGDIPFAMSGTIIGNNLEGENRVQYQNRDLLWKVKAMRK